MYFDEDGDLAHEFYEEVMSKKGKKRKMRKISSKLLTPQGDVPYTSRGFMWTSRSFYIKANHTK